MEKRVILSWSGGKDSTYLLIECLRIGMRIDEVFFADTGAEFKYMTDVYIPRVMKYCKDNFGFDNFKILKPKTTWDDWFFKKKVRGENKGQIYAFPLSRKCHLNSALKMQPINEYYKTLEGEYIVLIGIAANEPERYNRLKANERAPLYEWNIHEDIINDELKKIGLYNKLYDTFDRLGCFGCSNINMNELRKYRKHYTEDWNKLLQYGKYAEDHATKRRFAEFKKGYTLSELEHVFSTEDRQVSMFDLYSF